MQLPVLPPHIVYCDSYRPDAATRINHKFIIFEYINTKDRFNWDIGGLCILLLHKDIIEYAVAVISDDVYKEYQNLIAKIRKHRTKKLPELVILREKELERWLREKVKHSELWKPTELITA